MRTLLLLLGLFPLIVSAQTIGDAINSVKERVMGTECERTLDDAQKFSSYSVYAAQSKDWDAAFNYDNQAFIAIVVAQRVCVNEPDNLKKANSFHGEHFQISERIVCTYHASEAQDRIRQAKIAINVEQPSDNNEASFHTRWAIYHLDEGIQRCGYNPERIELLKNIKEHAVNLLNALENE